MFWTIYKSLCKNKNKLSVKEGNRKFGKIIGHLCKSNILKLAKSVSGRNNINNKSLEEFSENLFIKYFKITNGKLKKRDKIKNKKNIPDNISPDKYFFDNISCDYNERSKLCEDISNANTDNDWNEVFKLAEDKKTCKKNANNTGKKKKINNNNFSKQIRSMILKYQ